MRPVGAVLVILGFLGLVFGGIPYDKKVTVAEVGSLKMQATEKRQLGLPPFANGLAILLGSAFWFRAERKPRA